MCIKFLKLVMWYLLYKYFNWLNSIDVRIFGDFLIVPMFRIYLQDIYKRAHLLT